MADHLVSLPASALAQSVKADTIALLAIIGRFVYPERWATGELEQALSLRFTAISTIGTGDITAWFADAAIPFSSLSALVDQFNSGSREPLHTELMAENDAGSPQLLAVTGATLVDSTGRALTGTSGSCYLLRVGYAEDGTAYYYASVPAYSHTPAKIPWTAIATVQLSAALSISSPKPAPDLSGLQDSLHILDQAITTAQQAHSDILAILGLEASTGSHG